MAAKKKTVKKKSKTKQQVKTEEVLEKAAPEDDWATSDDTWEWKLSDSQQEDEFGTCPDCPDDEPKEQNSTDATEEPLTSIPLTISIPQLSQLKWCMVASSIGAALIISATLVLLHLKF